MAKTLVIKGANFSTNALDHVTYDGVHAESIAISQASATFGMIGETLRLAYTVAPSDSTDAVLWTSSDSAVASVTQNGLVTATGCGQCTITVSAGSVSANCVITVEVELTYGRYKQAMAQASNSTNRLTYFDAMNAGSSSYRKYMCCCNAESVFTNLIIDKDMTIIDSTTGVYRAMVPSEMSGGNQRVYNNIGYPIPISLPANCTKIKCVSISADYAPYIMFFQKNVRAYPAGSTTEGRGYDCANRYLCDTIANTALSYQINNEFDVPQGYDSICVVWVAKDSATMIPDLTDTQINAFKIVAL